MSPIRFAMAPRKKPAGKSQVTTLALALPSNAAVEEKDESEQDEIGEENQDTKEDVTETAENNKSEEKKTETSPKKKPPKDKNKGSTSKPSKKGKGKGGKGNKPMKRPAGAPGTEPNQVKNESVLDKTTKWMKQIGNKGKEDNSSSEENAAEEAAEETGKRHRGKAKKFKKMADSGAIPDHIWEMFQTEAAKHPKPRQFKTELINKLFKEDGNGGYIMCAEDPWFQQQKEMFHKKYGKDEQQGTPRDVFVYQVFHGNSEALDAAIQNGSVQQWTQDGIPFCGFRKTKAGVENARKDKSQIGAKQVDLKDSQYQAINKAFKTLSWSFGNQEVAEGGASVGAPSSSSGKRKQLEDVGLTKQMVEILQDAKNAHEKLHSTAMKLLNKCSAGEDKKDFKTTVMALKSWSLKNDHILTWKELPDESALTPTNFQAFMSEQAESTRKLNEEVEKFKALLKTRGEL